MKHAIFILGIIFSLTISSSSIANLEQSYEQCNAEMNNNDIVMEVCDRMHEYRQGVGATNLIRDNIGLANAGTMQIYKDYAASDHQNLAYALNLLRYVTPLDNRMAIFDQETFTDTVSWAVNSSTANLMPDLRQLSVPLQYMRAKYWSVVFHVEPGPYDSEFRSNRPLSNAVVRKLSDHIPIISSSRVLTWDRDCPHSIQGVPTGRVYFTCPYRTEGTLAKILRSCCSGTATREAKRCL